MAILNPVAIGYDASANCHGTCFLNGSANLYSADLTDEVLKQEGWGKIGELGDPNLPIEKGDVLIYRNNTGILDHSELSPAAQHMFVFIPVVQDMRVSRSAAFLMRRNKLKCVNTCICNASHKT